MICHILLLIRVQSSLKYNLCEIYSTIWPATADSASRLLVADRYLTEDENTGHPSEETLAVNVLGAALVAASVLIVVIVTCHPFRKGLPKEGQKDGGAA